MNSFFILDISDTSKIFYQNVLPIQHRAVNNRKAVKGASIRLLWEGLSFCEGSALNLPQEATPLDPKPDTLRSRKFVDTSTHFSRDMRETIYKNYDKTLYCVQR